MHYMNSKVSSLLCSALLFTAIALLAQPQHQTPTPPIRVTVNRVNVPVTASDSEGHPVGGLHREDFHIFDNGVDQPITDFAPVEQSTQVVLLIESGPAVLFLAKDHVHAADAFLRTIPPADPVAIASYTRTPELILNFTSDKMAARQALQQLSFVNGFGDLNTLLQSRHYHRLDHFRPRQENHRPALHRSRQFVAANLGVRSEKTPDLRRAYLRRLALR